MTKAYTREQVVARLSEYVAAHGKKTTAERFGCQLHHIGAILRGERSPGPKVLRGLGLVRAYVEAPESA